MNHRVIYLLGSCLFVALLLTGCQLQGQPSIPLTGDENSSLIAPFEEARGNVLAYVTSSSRVPAVPQDADWQLDITKQTEGQHHFRSGDWHMIVWDADDRNEKNVVLMNEADDVFWCGYIDSDGRVVDTYYSR